MLEKENIIIITQQQLKMIVQMANTSKYYRMGKLLKAQPKKKEPLISPKTKAKKKANKKGREN
jgi:hypothetical protein